MSRQHSFLPLRPPNHSKRKIPRPPQPQSPVSWGPEKKAAPGIRFPFSFPRFAHSTFDFTPSIYQRTDLFIVVVFLGRRVRRGHERKRSDRTRFHFLRSTNGLLLPLILFSGALCRSEGRAIKPKEMGSPPFVGTGPMRSGYQDCRQLSLRPTDCCCCRLRES